MTASKRSLLLSKAETDGLLVPIPALVRVDRAADWRAAHGFARQQTSGEHTCQGPVTFVQIQVGCAPPYALPLDSILSCTGWCSPRAGIRHRQRQVHAAQGQTKLQLWQAGSAAHSPGLQESAPVLRHIETSAGLPCLLRPNLC